MGCLICLIYSCQQRNPKYYNQDTLVDFEQIKPKYARGFEIYKKKDISVIKIKNPWQKAEDIEFNYALISSNDNKDRMDEEYVVINLPIQTIVCLSTTHIAYIDALNELNSIKGISGTSYVNNEFLANNIKAGEVQEVGYEQNINYETIINLNPDIIFAYSIGAENIGYLNKFKEIGIPVFYIAEYLEQDPLGKSEWIKVVAEFFNKTQEADSIFNIIENEYLNIKTIISEIEYKPNVLTGLPWKGTWFITGGKSHLANLIHDAGGQYLWRDMNIYRSEPLSLEAIFQRGVCAECWINCSDANSIQDIIAVDERIKALPIIKKGNIYNNNARINANGGNDYWETGVMNPHIVLKDLLKIFHPEIDLEHELHYYKKLN
ncbi:ABC transporter substrate-binding protein [Bacteroidota bacterium]